MVGHDGGDREMRKICMKMYEEFPECVCVCVCVCVLCVCVVCVCAVCVCLPRRRHVNQATSVN